MRIAIVNDMRIAIELIRRALVADGRHTLAWTALNGQEAVERCARDRPDLILMDLIMPVLDGVEATRRIMAETPCAILIVTATVEGNSSRVYEALGAGAIDAVQTPDHKTGPSLLRIKIDQLEKLLNRPSFDPSVSANSDVATAPACPPPGAAEALVAIGASAGGPAALATLFAALPAGYRAPIVVIQHIDAGFARGLIDWLSRHCALPVSLAVDGEAPAPGHIYLGAGDHHLTLAPGGRFRLTPARCDCIYLPGIDVFFSSMAAHWRRRGLGILLTGMGRDGAAGLRALRQAGFETVAQDRSTSAVYGMPKAAADLKAATHILPLPQIPPLLRAFA